MTESQPSNRTPIDYERFDGWTFIELIELIDELEYIVNRLPSHMIQTAHMIEKQL